MNHATSFSKAENSRSLARPASWLALYLLAAALNSLELIKIHQTLCVA